MKKNVITWMVASVFCAALAGCAAGGPDDPIDSGEGSDDSSADTGADPTSNAPPLETESWNGKCCHFKCTNHVEYWSATPVYGSCTNYAEFYCPSYGKGSYSNGSAYWGTCY